MTTKNFSKNFEKTIDLFYKIVYNYKCQEGTTPNDKKTFSKKFEKTIDKKTYIVYNKYVRR